MTDKQQARIECNGAGSGIGTGRSCHAQLLAVTIHVIWLVGFSVEVVFALSCAISRKASLLKIAFSGFDIAVFN